MDDITSRLTRPTDPQQADASLVHVWRGFCDQLAEAGEVLLRPETPKNALDQAEGLRYLSRLTRTALNMEVDSSDPDFPRLFQLSDDAIKIGADNPDNIYQQAVVSGDRDYRIWGKRGTVPYLSIGSKANRYATDGSMASTGEIEFSSVKVDENGCFEIIASREPKPGRDWLPLAEDSSLLIIRQTFEDKKRQIPAEIYVECLSRPPAKPLLTPETITTQLNKAAAWVKGTANMFADWSEWFKQEPNRIYQQKDQSVWYRAGGDPKIWYGHFYYDLKPDEALVIEVQPPRCRMWNVQLDNWWMESLDHVHQKIWVNSSQATYEEDGRIIVVAGKPVAKETKNENEWDEIDGGDQIKARK